MTQTLPSQQPVRAPKTAELIATRIRRQIVRRELRAGQTLPAENELMEQFGVSRPTLREAVRILEAEGLLDIRRGSRGGAVVLTPDLQVAARYVGLILQLQGTTIEDVYEARATLEPACARLAAQRRTEADLRALRDAAAVVRSIVRAGVDAVPDPLAWARSTYDFHDAVLQSSGSRTLAVQGGVLQDIAARHLGAGVAIDFGDPLLLERFRRTIRSYDRLTTLVDARDADGAERHWRRHMEVAAQTLLREELKSRTVVDLFS